MGEIVCIQKSLDFQTDPKTQKKTHYLLEWYFVTLFKQTVNPLSVRIIILEDTNRLEVGLDVCSVNTV